MNNVEVKITDNFIASYIVLHSQSYKVNQLYVFAARCICKAVQANFSGLQLLILQFKLIFLFANRFDNRKFCLVLSTYARFPCAAHSILGILPKRRRLDA